MKNRSVDYLFSSKAVRETTAKVYQAALKGKTHFKINEDKLLPTVEFVCDVIQENYPDLNIPFHSRWRHFLAGGIEREKMIDEKLVEKTPLEKASVKCELALVSVLLDAGAGMEWRYLSEGREYKRSEGLAVASFEMFMNGVFAKDKALKVEGDRLMELSLEELEKGFQVSENNPLVGANGRLELLHRLGKIVFDDKECFQNRPGNMAVFLKEKYGPKLKAIDLLSFVLHRFSSIWPGREEIDGICLGDVWPYGKEDIYVCFHKLPQWLTYSLIGPLTEGGIEVSGVDELTGLAEYRNGGLFIDSGLLELRDPCQAQRPHRPNSDLVIEWRAMTVQLLDQVARQVRKKFNKSSEEFPLCRALEGGTWWAGRKLAKKLRSDMGPPLKIESDGTVF